MIINHNMAAMNTHRQLGSNNAAAANNIEKLSSGLKINKAGDDAAGLAISEKMRGQIRGLDMAAKNSQDGISLIQTAEGSLNETHDILQRMRELAVQAGNDTNTSNDRQEVQKEINSLTSEINRIGNTTEFNTQKLLNGSKTDAAGGAEPGSAASLKVDLTGMVTSESVVVMGESIAFDTDIPTTLTKGAAALNDTDAFSAKYTATVSGNELIITAKNVGVNADLTADKIDASGVTGTPTASVTAGVNQEQALNFQIGANQDQSLTLNIGDMRSVALGISTTGTTNENLAVNNGTNSTTTEQALDVSTHENAANAVTKIQAAIDKVSGERSKLGSTQNRLEHTINNLGTSSENLTAAESRIRDVDYVIAA
ncbi:MULTISPECIES: flagellin [unclassified Sporosarcina]|uniref:flagellin N-terminal helical domain-containing protein n=1 Tax=unclassified Sporosarcina TaxID=2647733 RepID=UPI000C1655E3|nr:MULTISPECIES: flagellin [unclassified Sporosarcina]PID05009.1 flagellin [Sporosarcina sp. P30]PID08009.1 flagellin [Sporosarcina sp. P31]PID11763.1 flagellin [Sporosarcina sp. P32b]